ncbi:MAG TPA: cytochrome c3 family protein [Dongiaceae bacterium]|nr:cytochrome c3 family protein [Dongiaceae bacterium]
MNGQPGSAASHGLREARRRAGTLCALALAAALGAAAWIHPAGALPTVGETGTAAHDAFLDPSCGGCHAGAAEASHPTGIVPTRPLPSAFPLGAGGDIVCTTCHDLDAVKPGLLRAADRQSLCLSCHVAAFFAGLPDPVRVLMFAGHLDARGGSSAGIDAYSLRCMSCHDDQAAGDTRVAAAAGATLAAESDNHPVGVKYDEAARFGGYVPTAEAAAEVFLPDGRIGCVSCHVPYARAHGQPPQTRSGLCFACHAL